MTDGKGQEINIGAFKFGVLEMINEGIDIENEDKEEKMEFVTLKQVGRIITEIGMQKMTDRVQETVIESTKDKQFGFKAILPNEKKLVCLGDEPYNEVNREYVENCNRCTMTLFIRLKYFSICI